MDKYDIVLDLIEHPADYTPERIAEILSDPEAREIYNLLCKTDSAFSSNDCDVDVEAEWLSFSQRHKKPAFKFMWIGNRAATIAAIAFTSLAAVAIGITLAVKSLVPQTVEISSTDIAPQHIQSIQQTYTDSTRIVIAPIEPILFEDTSLEEILTHIAAAYNVELELKNPETAQLHLYYKFNPNLPPQETVEQLNTFEQINIRIAGNKIIVD